MNAAAPSSNEIQVSAVCLLVLWIGCATVSLVGYILPYARPSVPQKPDLPLQAEILQVELSDDALPALTQPAEPSAFQPPSITPLPSAPAVPSLTAAAEPTTVAFALPIEGPVTVVEPARASFAAAPTIKDPVPVAPPVTRLTYGQGEGRQPAPEYPLRARREGQEGTVGVRFSVGEDGRVLAAETSAPCAWKLLNDAAVRVIRERWRFPAGVMRLYEVSIRFQLTK